MKITREIITAALEAFDEMSGDTDERRMNMALAAASPLILEEAAKLCERLADGQDEAGYCSAAWCAEEIRELGKATG